MTNIIRWAPMKDLFNIQEEINKVFGSYNDREASIGWSPAVDVHETDNKYTIKADIPGIKKEDIKLSIENNTLSISGERNEEKEEKGKNFLRREKHYGSFYRSFSLPRLIDSKNINASYEAGVLTVDIPKAEESKPKEIKIDVK